MNEILNHWLNGRTIEWIAKRENMTVENVANKLGFGVRRK